jgi:hypothetical protein
VSKLTAVGDMLWCDPAWDLASLRYPPFAEAGKERWRAFLRGCGPAPERKRLLLYAVLQRLYTFMGAYMEPQAEGNAAWVRARSGDAEAFLDEIEGDALCRGE